MKSTRSFKQHLSKVFRHWRDEQYDLALSDVEEMLKSWPGNAQLYIFWASLVQLQEAPSHRLEEAKKALQQAIEVDANAPAGPIELGHYLDAVEDNPRAASKAFSEGIRSARRLLMDGLLGQARALLQLDKRAEALKCLMEWLYLANIDDPLTGSKSANGAPDILLRDPTGQILAIQLKGPIAVKIEELLQQLFPEQIRIGTTA
jgi:tetratricopeptide (TPR) repeat protein